MTGSGSGADMLIWKVPSRRELVDRAASSTAGILLPVGRDPTSPRLAPLGPGGRCLQMVVGSWADDTRLTGSPAEAELVGTTSRIQAQKSRGRRMGGLCWDALAFR